MFGQPNKEGGLQVIVDKLFAELASANRRTADLLEAHASLIEAHRELERELSEMRQIVPVQPSFQSNRPMHVPEFEQEVKWLEENGLIGAEQMKDLLAEADFLNTEIEFAE